MAVEEDEDEVIIQPRRNGHAAVSDDDVRELLAAERAKNAKLTERIAAERVERNKAEAIARTSTDARFDTEGKAVEDRLKAATDKVKDLKAAYATALAEGRFEEAAEIQDQMAQLRATEQHDKQYKAWLDGEAARAKARPAPAAEIDLSNYTPGQRKWIKQHPEFMEDEAFRKKTEAGHSLAVADGLEVDSPEYFDVIDEVIARKTQGRQRQRVERPEEEEEFVDPPPRQRQREADTDLPVTRRGATPGQREERRGAVRLTGDQKEAADATLPHLPTEGYTDEKTGRYVASRYERYAANVKTLKAQGRI